MGWIWALAGCGAVQNPVDEGQPIPDHDIVSCGDALVGQAPPAGALDGTVTVRAKTTFSGTVALQASCPEAPTEPPAATEFDLTELRLYQDDAGFPGDPIGSTAVSVAGVVSCDGALFGGATEQQDLPDTEVTDLASLCDGWAADPYAGPLYVQVELSGAATTCSDQDFDVLLRSRVGVDCG